MKRYEKPSVSVIELQLKENIAAVPTTVYKGLTGTNNSKLVDMALTQEGTGIVAGKYGDLDIAAS